MATQPTTALEAFDKLRRAIKRGTALADSWRLTPHRLDLGSFGTDDTAARRLFGEPETGLLSRARHKGRRREQTFDEYEATVTLTPRGPGWRDQAEIVSWMFLVGHECVTWRGFATDEDDRPHWYCTSPGCTKKMPVTEQRRLGILAPRASKAA